MKSSGTCPKCRSTTLLHVERVAANRVTGSLQLQPTFRLAVTGKGPEGSTGELEAYACPRCHLVELYLAKPLTADGVHVREVSIPVQGPHRT